MAEVYAHTVEAVQGRTPFEAYLKCGGLEEGFLRVKCDSWQAEKLVAFPAWLDERRPGSPARIRPPLDTMPLLERQNARCVVPQSLLPLGSIESETVKFIRRCNDQIPFPDAIGVNGRRKSRFSFVRSQAFRKQCAEARGPGREKSPVEPPPAPRDPDCADRDW